jgi:putative FmdB family regulatory protein
MPMYEYVCQECQHQFETLVFGTETVECPHCESDRLERLLSVPGAPRVNAAAGLPMTCDPATPPCGPMCRKLGS